MKSDEVIAISWRGHGCGAKLVGVDPRAVKESQLDLYEAGSYAGLSATIAPAAAQLVAAAGPLGGDRVLDAGAGDGTVSILVARAGGLPVACDLSAVQLMRAKDRVADLGVVQADVERLPFADASFDAVLSSFGAVIAPDPDRTAAELFRVCAPHGLVGLTAWPPDSLVGEMNAAVREASGFADRFPDQELGWGVPEVVAERLGSRALDVHIRRLSFTWDGVTRGSEGKRDYAAAYFAQHLPDLDLADMRNEILARHRDADGRLVADYLLMTGRAR
ncbi:MAG TPA: class I SAM-dependent methyltransferase [Actinomycetes bacterium]